MPLSERLAAISAAAVEKVPAAMRAVLGRSIEELRTSGALDGAIQVGQPVPDFVLPDQNGSLVRLSDQLKAGPVALALYRGIWCPYCNEDLKELQANLPAIRATGASLLAISPQTPPNSRRTARDLGLEFPILSDAGNAVAASLGLRFALKEDAQDVHRTLGADLPAFNGDTSWTLPVPARVLVGVDGIARYVDFDPDYTRRPDPDALLAALRGTLLPA